MTWGLNHGNVFLYINVLLIIYQCNFVIFQAIGALLKGVTTLSTPRTAILGSFRHIFEDLRGPQIAKQAYSCCGGSSSKKSSDLKANSEGKRQSSMTSKTSTSTTSKSTSTEKKKKKKCPPKIVEKEEKIEKKVCTKKVWTPKCK